MNNMTNYDRDLLNLMLSETGYRSASFYASALKVSQKTIYNHSKNIETFLSDNGLSLERLPRKGFLIVGSEEKKQHVRLTLGNNVSAEQDTTFSPQYRRLYLFAKILFSDRKSYRHYAETFFVSVQSIKKDFDAVSDFLKKNDINLDKTVSSFNDEIKIEQAFRKYLDLYLKHSDLSDEQTSEIFGSTISEIATTFVEDNSQQDSHVQDEYLPISLRESLFIFLNRVKYGLNLTQPENHTVVLDVLKNTDLSNVVFNLTEVYRSSTGVKISGENLRFLYLLLLGHGIRSNPDDFASKHDFTLESKKLIKKISSTLGMKLDNDAELLKVTIYHLIPMIARLNLGLHITDPLKGEISSHYRLIAQAVKTSATGIEEHYQIKLSDDEISLLSLHFLVAVERHRKANNILVVCHAGAEISQYVLLSLQNNLPPHNVLTLISPNELFRMKLSSFDLLVSTTNVTVNSLPTIYISVLPRKEEISPIYWRLVELDHKKSIKAASVTPPTPS
ncbi:L-ascorbate-6-phosphate lactonase [Furfurilactobacillus siliginis]|uniref:L-ascorbate-6-phosphate lactonase n=2 Tax=Furfurilactobacillus siliginis TaxID=348151 RepID=A0A510VS81_9LACO|nr:L-ascorbate-6-phosphate lactonase [Furfurilactobacillus siliginis]